VLFHTFVPNMKDPILNAGVIAGLVSVILKMVYFLGFYPNDDFDMYVRFAYLLAFLLALFLGLRAWKGDHLDSKLVDDVKAGMKVASLYALILAPFTYIYYKWINPEYFQDRMEQAIAAAQESTPDQVEQVRETVSFIFDAFTHATITLFGLLFIGFLYTLVIVAIFRTKPEMVKN